MRRYTRVYVASDPQPDANFGAVARFQGPTVAPLGGPHELSLSFRHTFAAVSIDGSRRQWEARTTGYIYNVHDAHGDIVVAFHWHAEGESDVTWPHVHVYGRAGLVPTGRVHLPTRELTPDEILACLARDLGVPTRAD